MTSFSIGLVLAGASTGGSYSAGVMDFLLEALLEWEKAKSEGKEGVPDHQVDLRVISGTSAGGITATVALSALCSKEGHNPLAHDYKYGDPKPENNKLWNSWVEGLSLENMLATNDLKDKNAEVRSLASADYVVQLAKNAIEGAPAKTIPKFARTLDLYLTVANLRGVPYQIKGFKGQAGTMELNQVLYQDWMKYHVGKDCPSDAFLLDHQKPRDSKNWQSIARAAMATGAYPVVFGTVDCTRPTSHYEKRFEYASPSFPCDFPADYKFHAIDGGMFNVRPLELTRKELMKAKMNLKNKNFVFSEKASDVEMATIMIDPFPKSEARDESEYDAQTPDIFSSLGQLYGALIGNGRFKEEELEGAYDDSDFSKFIISPRRSRQNKNVLPALASEELDHFAGLLDEKLRIHDFILGRRNAQRFLLNHFGVPEEEAKKNEALHYAKVCTLRAQKNYVPIIPLVGSAAKPIEEPEWPFYTAVEKKEIVKKATDLLNTRLIALSKRLVQKYIIDANSVTENSGREEERRRGPFGFFCALFGTGARIVKSIVSPITRGVRSLLTLLIVHVITKKARKRITASFEKAVEETLKAISREPRDS